MDTKLLPCPLCLKPTFQGVDILRITLINVATSPITCPVCNELLMGLDKLTIHLFSHVSQNCSNQQKRTNFQKCANFQKPAKLQQELAAHEEKDPIKFQEQELANLQKQNLASLQKQELGTLHKQELEILRKQELETLREQQLEILQKQELESLQKQVISTNHQNPGLLQHHQKEELYQRHVPQRSKDFHRRPQEKDLPEGDQNSQLFQTSKKTQTVFPENSIQFLKTDKVLLQEARLTPKQTEEIPTGNNVNQISWNMEVTQEETPKNLRCDICNYTFNDENILEMHQKLLHQTSVDNETGAYSYHCHLCSKKFKMKGSLMVHLRVAHYSFVHQNSTLRNSGSSSDVKGTSGAKGCLEVREYSEVKGYSDVKGYSESNGYSEEKRTSKLIEPSEVTRSPEADNIENRISKDTNNKQWECDVCSKMFTTKYFLKKHKRLHTGEMPYFCNQCSKSFTFQQSYHKHMLYHTSEKPHVCNECGRAFKELSTLHNHERIHSGERPFACETCGKCFRQRVSYLVHRRIHTGIMPYKCTACEKTFRYKVSQRSHKCTANPPGTVIRSPDIIDSADGIAKIDGNSGRVSRKPRSFNPLSSYSKMDQNSPKAMSLLSAIQDALNLNTPQRNLTAVNLQEKALVVEQKFLSSLEKHKFDDSGSQNLEELLSEGLGDQENLSDHVEGDLAQDFFYSPVLPDVEGLRLNSPKEAERENLQTINEESFKELLYGATNL